MEIDNYTHEIFTNFKCGLISMTQEKHVYDTQKGDFLFFYPSRNKITINRVVGRTKKTNLPIVKTEINESEWEVNDNEELKMALDLINNN